MVLFPLPGIPRHQGAIVHMRVLPRLLLPSPSIVTSQLRQEAAGGKGNLPEGKHFHLRAGRAVSQVCCYQIIKYYCLLYKIYTVILLLSLNQYFFISCMIKQKFYKISLNYTFK